MIRDRLQKACRLSLSDWLTLFEVYCLLVVVELGLKVLPLKTLLKLLQRGVDKEDESGDPEGKREMIEQTVYLVRIASRYNLFNTTCLKRSLVAYWLLKRKGIHVHLSIGVEKIGGRLEGHAWLENQGEAILDVSERSERFKTVIPLLK